MHIQRELFYTTPNDVDKRLEKERRCYELLDNNNIMFSGVDHDYADTIEMCHEVELVLGCKICKNLFLTNRQMTEFYLLMMPGDKTFKTKVLSKALGVSRLSFGNESQMQEYLDVTPGSVSILGLMNDNENKVRLVIDNELLGDEYLGCHPCINSSTIKIRMKDVINKLIPALGHNATYVELTSKDEML